MTAATGGMLLGAPAPAPAVWAGTVLVAVGLAVGLGASRPKINPGAGAVTRSVAQTSP